MKVILGVDVSLKVAKTLASAKTITGITKASPGVCTSVAHGYASGDWIVLAVSAGMWQLDGQMARVIVLTADTFSLEGIDTTNFATHSAATCQKITAWEEFDNAQSWSLDEGNTDRPDISIMHKRRKQTMLGASGELTGSIDVISNPAQAAIVLIRAATRNQARMAQLLTFATGDVIGVNAEWAGGNAIKVDRGQVSTSKIDFSVVGEPVILLV